MVLPVKSLSRLLCGITSNHNNGNYCVYIHLEQKIKIKIKFDTCYNNPEKLLRIKVNNHIAHGYSLFILYYIFIIT